MPGVQFKRVDADTPDKLIDKDEKIESVLSETDQTSIKALFDAVVDHNAATVVMLAQAPDAPPVNIVKPEFMRRMKEMSYYNGMEFAANMPDQYNLVVNTNHPIINKILQQTDEEKKNSVAQLHSLALLSQGMLKGNDLTGFINRSYEML
jgi:molecular chaperone HtpG